MSRWDRFCVVGIGGHARTKLIPAIAANGQSLAALVSRQAPDALPDAPVYPTLDAALPHLAPGTAIVLASPPALHFEQARAAIGAGFDVIVEKPAFMTAEEARAAAAMAAATGTVLAEAFMQRHTELYRRLLAHCAATPVTALDLAFLVPALPAGTFRAPDDLAGSSLYDIGCYILALLSDLGLPLDGLDIVAVRDAGTMAEAVDLAGTLAGVAVTATIGVGPDYRNHATVRCADGSATEFRPVFYGRAGPRTIGDATIEDDNAFEAMFATPREAWLADQAARLAGMVAVTERLEALGRQLVVWRSGRG